MADGSGAVGVGEWTSCLGRAEEAGVGREDEKSEREGGRGNECQFEQGGAGGERVHEWRLCNAIETLQVQTYSFFLGRLTQWHAFRPARTHTFRLRYKTSKQ